MTTGKISRAVDGILESSVVGSFTRIGSAIRARGEHWTDPTDLHGRRVVVTGATSGIGLAAAQRMAALGAEVVLVGRDDAKLERARETVAADATGEIRTLRCDLSLCRDTVELADVLATHGSPIDVLVHNAGALLREHRRTAEGVETTVATHLVNPYVLTERLIEREGLGSRARVIVMSSGGMYSQRPSADGLEMDEAEYSGTVAYARAKRAQTLLVRHWTDTYGDRGLSFHGVHPGWVDTPGVDSGLPIFSVVMSPLLRSPQQGADTTVWLAGSPDGQPESGLFWHDRHPRSLYRVPGTKISATHERDLGARIAQWCSERASRALNPE